MIPAEQLHPPPLCHSVPCTRGSNPLPVISISLLGSAELGTEGSPPHLGGGQAGVHSRTSLLKNQQATIACAEALPRRMALKELLY